MNRFNSLTIRIFAIFWLTLAIVVMTVLMVPKLDTRQLTNLTSKELTQANLLQKNIEAELQKSAGNKKVNWRYLFKLTEQWLPPGENILLTTTEGRLIGMPRHEMKSIRNFIGQSDNLDQPKKKKYERVEIIGPFIVNTAAESYLLYRLRPSNSSQSNFINRLFDHPFYLLIVTMLISSPLLLWLAWSLAKPARKLKAAADEVALGNLTTHPELEAGPIEFRSAGISFNHMIGGLARLITAQQRLISDISHELRTPLTRLQLATALMRRKQGENSELERIEIEALRLESMINNLLMLSRNQYKNEFDHEQLMADELWADMLENAQFEAEQMGKKLEILAAPQSWPLLGNRRALDSCLENVIRNALYYSDSYITIKFTADERGITIQVEDDGLGVAEEEREQIFRPFYRTDEARDRSSGGNGLGLAIVDSAVKQQGGKVKAEQSSLGGLKLTIWLPLYIY